MFARLIKSITLGLRRRWYRGLSKGFGSLGLIWLITSVGTFVYEPTTQYLKQHGTIYFFAALSVFGVVFLFDIYERRSVSFKLPTTDTVIEVKFGDLFEERGNLLFGVNEFFDSALGQAVAPRSVHGQFIANLFNSNEARFRADVDAALNHATAIQTNDRPEDQVRDRNYRRSDDWRAQGIPGRHVSHGLKNVEGLSDGPHALERTRRSAAGGA